MNTNVDRPSSKLSQTTAVILAAGQGTRMKSALPKVLHGIAGRPILYYPVRAALEAGCGSVVVVVGHGRDLVRAYLAETFGDRVTVAIQEEQRGTGDALRAGLGGVDGSAKELLVFYGDVPLLMAKDVSNVAAALPDHGEGGLALATCVAESPFGYGRVLRSPSGDIVEIREEKDLRSESERAIREINPGIYAASRSFFQDAVASLRPNNAQGELYLTDIVAFAAAKKTRVHPVPSRAEVLVGVNDRDQLVAAEEVMYARIAKSWRVAGVLVRPSARIDDGVQLAADSTIESGCVLRGKTRVERGALIDVGSVLTNAVVGENAIVKPYSVITDSSVGGRAEIGPFSHLRPGSEIGDEAHIGNFVETKKTRLGKGAKANHLAYLGDGIIGERANIGAGTIFCNYDGFQKHTTTIEAGAFIGSDSQIVAPVTIGAGAYVGTGTTVTKNVPPDALAISRVKQENKEGYALKLKGRLKAAKDAKAQSASKGGT